MSTIVTNHVCHCRLKSHAQIPDWPSHSLQLCGSACLDTIRRHDRARLVCLSSQLNVCPLLPPFHRVEIVHALQTSQWRVEQRDVGCLEPGPSCNAIGSFSSPPSTSLGSQFVCANRHLGGQIICYMLYVVCCMLYGVFVALFCSLICSSLICSHHFISLFFPPFFSLLFSFIHSFIHIISFHVLTPPPPP